MTAICCSFIGKWCRREGNCTFEVLKLG